VATSAMKETRKEARDSSFEERRAKSSADNDIWASAREIHASRQASHSSGTRWCLHAAVGKRAIGGSENVGR
jgi:hypothetical protein